MDRNLVFNLAKDELINVITELTTENYQDKKGHIAALQNILENISILPLIKEEINEEHTISNEIIEPIATLETKKHIEDGYVFERKLTGGFIPDIDSFVPDKELRLRERGYCIS